MAQSQATGCAHAHVNVNMRMTANQPILLRLFPSATRLTASPQLRRRSQLLTLLLKRIKDARPRMTQWRKPDGTSVSGTIIDDDILRQPRFYRDAGCILWLYQHFALNGANEAVNEGMSIMFDIHAEGRRHLSQSKSKQETCIHWNGPPPCNAEPVLRASLDRHFGSNTWHFRLTSVRGQAAQAERGGLSIVLKRKSERRARCRF
jgi:hypothetical protein